VRLLFLDIDGVVVLQEWGTPNWNYRCVANLKTFLDACPDIKIVLSSTWRFKPRLIHAFMDLMASQAVDNDVIGMTPNIDLLSRDKEVVTYLNDLARARLLLDVDDYVRDWVVVDDAPEFFKGGLVPADHIEYVERHTGFTLELAEKLIERFRRS
jgi:hypothetical protein